MSETTITILHDHGMQAGDRIRITLPRPAWWRLIQLWKWWRSPIRRTVFTITDTSDTTLTVS